MRLVRRLSEWFGGRGEANADGVIAIAPIPDASVRAIEKHLHNVIRSREARLIDEHSWPLPSLAAMLAGEATDQFRPAVGSTQEWFYPVPGMYGGFNLRWLAGGEAAKLESISFCRIAGGSGERHEITAAGAVLVESGLF